MAQVVTLANRCTFDAGIAYRGTRFFVWFPSEETVIGRLVYGSIESTSLVINTRWFCVSGSWRPVPVPWVHFSGVVSAGMKKTVPRKDDASTVEIPRQSGTLVGGRQHLSVSMK